MLRNLFKSISKIILTFITLIAVIILIFSLWFGIKERSMPFQSYVLKAINAKAKPFILHSEAIMLRTSFDTKFLNIRVVSPKVLKDGKELASLPNLHLKTNPIFALRNKDIALHFNFQEFNLHKLFPRATSEVGDKVDFAKLFEIIENNWEIIQIFSLNLTDIELSKGIKFNLHGLRFEEFEEGKVKIMANISSKGLGLNSRVVLDGVLDSAKNLSFELKNEHFKLKNKNLVEGLKIEMQNVDFRFSSTVKANSTKLTNSKLNISGNAVVKYGDTSYKIENIDAIGIVDVAASSIAFEEMEFDVNNHHIKSNLLLNKENFSTSATIPANKYKSIITLLPSNFIPNTRQWLNSSIKGGEASVNFAFDYKFGEDKLNYDVQIPFSNVNFKFHKKMPEVENANGSVAISAKKVAIEIVDSKILDITNISATGEVKFPQIVKKNTEVAKKSTNVSNKEEGESLEVLPAESVIEGLESEPRKGLANSAILKLTTTSSGDRLQNILKLASALTGAEIPPINAKAEVDTVVSIHLPIETDEKLDDALNLKIESQIDFLEFEQVYNNNLKDLKVKFIYENKDINADGTILYDNSIPLHLQYSKTLGRNFKFDINDVEISYKNDVAKLRDRFDIPEFLSGDLNAQIKLQGANKIDISSNLVGLKIDAPALFLQKNPHSSSTFKVQVERGNNTFKLLNIDFEVPPVIIEGSLNIADGSVSGDLTYSHSEIGKLNIGYRGNFIEFNSNMLNFSKQNIFNFMVSKGASKKINYNGLIQNVLLKNNIKFSNLKISNQFCPDCKLELSAKIMPNNTDFQMVKRANSTLINSNDAGSILKGLNIFEKVELGVLQVKLDQSGVGEVAGNITIDDFRVIQNNFFIKLFALPSLTVSPQTLKELVEGGSLPFKTLVCPVNIGASRITFNKCVAKSNAINIKISGVVDLNSNTIKMEGLFVPKNILNSIVKEIPLIGKVLSGGNNEGVIATTFKIEGSLEDPKIIINPLSTFTPGFTREILNVFN